MFSWLDNARELLRDPKITDVTFRYPHLIASCPTGHHVHDNTSDRCDALEEVQRFAYLQGILLNRHQPCVSGIFEGLRWTAIIPPLAATVPNLHFRRHRFSTLTLENYQISQEILTRLPNVISQRGSSVVIYGASGAGKSSLMYALLKRYCSDEKIALLGDIHEIPTADTPLWSTFQYGEALAGKIHPEELLQQVLRLRIDRIVLNEVRIGDMRALLHASSSGHLPLLATIHATDAASMKRRLLIEGKEWSQVREIWGLGLSPPSCHKPAVTELEKIV